MNNIEKSILATLVYYDVFERPLTAWEIYGNRIKVDSEQISFFNLLNTLDISLALNKKIDHFNGFYFLKNKQGIVEERIERQKLADQKWKKAKRIIKLLPAVPYIRMVAVSGSLAINNSKQSSDIDLLIVTKAGRIWTCRALTTLLLHLFGRRRHHSLTKDRFCLNHYITDQSLEFKGKSLYNAQTYANLVPVIDLENINNQFQKANSWIEQYLHFYPLATRGFSKKIKKPVMLNKIRGFREWLLDSFLGDRLEKYLGKKQSQRIKKDPLTCKPGGRVVFNDQQLEFHPDSPEKGILEKYNQKLIAMGLKELANQADSGLLT